MSVILENESFLPKIGGIETSIISMIKVFEKKKIRTYVLTRKLNENEKKVERFSKNTIIIRYSFKRNKYNYFTNWFQLITLIVFKKNVFKKIDFDYVISRNFFMAVSNIFLKVKVVFVPPGIIKNQLLEIKKAKNIKGIIFFIGRMLRGNIDSLLEKIAIKYSTKVVVFSDLMKDEIKRIYMKDVKVVSPGIDHEKFKVLNIEKDYIHTKYNLDKDNIYYIFSGRVSQIKNIELMIDLFYELKKYKKIKLLIVGDGEKGYFNFCKKKVDKLGLKDSIIFLGKQKNIEELYNISKFSILLSQSESFGQVITESLACGIPVIGYKKDKKKNIKVAFDEIIEDGKTGFIITTQSKEIEILKKSYNISDKKYLEMQKECLFESKKYDWKLFVEKIDFNIRDYYE